MRNPIVEYISQFPPTNSLLPLTHVTTLHGFRAIAAGDELVTAKCKYFGEEILYLFYGRPSYRSTQAAASELLWNAPVGFVIEPISVGDIERVFPLDSGAFKKGLYGNVFSPDTPIEALQLNSDFVTIQQYVSAFFGDNAAYMNGRSKVSHSLGNFDFELQGLAYMSRLAGQQSTGGGGVRIDERASAIEIQLTQPIDVKESVLALIVPEDIMADKVFLDAIDKWSIGPEKILPYTNVVGPGSEAWVGQFFLKTIEFYRERGFL